MSIDKINEFRKQFSDEIYNLQNYIYVIEDKLSSPSIDNVKSLCNNINRYGIKGFAFHNIDKDMSINKVSEILLSNSPCIFDAYHKINRLYCSIDYEYIDNAVPKSILLEILNYYYKLPFNNKSCIFSYDKFAKFIEDVISSILSDESIDSTHLKLIMSQNCNCSDFFITDCMMHLWKIIKDSFYDYVMFSYDYSIRKNLISHHASINIYRQSFILAVASFDAILQDLVSLLLKLSFCEHISSISKIKKRNNTYNLENFSYKSLEEFKDTMIENTLYGKYTSDLITFIKDGPKIDFYVKNGGKLIECIKRRNVHLHKRGIADKKYTKDYNIYNAIVNDYLIIDKEYFDTSLGLLSCGINELCNWMISNCVS